MARRTGLAPAQESVLSGFPTGQSPGGRRTTKGPWQSQQRREAKAHFGEFVQLDGSFHEWLEKRGPQGCFMHMVDDATTKGLGGSPSRKRRGAAAGVLRRWIERYGVPWALYTDWKNVYVRPPNAQERMRGEPAVTQFVLQGTAKSALGTGQESRAGAGK